MNGIDKLLEYLLKSDSDRILKSRADDILQPKHINYFVRQGVFVEFQLDEIICPKCKEDTIELEYADGKISGYCLSKNCGIVYSSQDQIVIYSVNFTKLIETLANELGLAGTKGKIQDFRLWHLGSGGTKKAAHTFYLLLQKITPDLLQALNSLADGDSGQIIFTAPSIIPSKPDSSSAKFLSLSTVENSVNDDQLFSVAGLKKIDEQSGAGFQIDKKNFALLHNHTEIVKLTRNTLAFKMLIALYEADGDTVAYTELYYTCSKRSAQQKAASDKCQRWRNDLLNKATSTENKTLVDKLITIGVTKTQQRGYRLNKKYRQT